MTNASDDELVVRAQKGDAEAVSLLYLNNYQSIYRYLYYRVGDPKTAEDLTSEVFIKMIQALPNYRHQNVPFTAWLFQITRNLAIDMHRKQNAHLVDSELHENIEEPGQTLDEILEDNLTRETLLKVMNNLTNDQRDVLILRFIDGLSLAQVALILRKSEDAIKGLQHRALTGLRAQLNRLEVENAKTR
jgi:RNA polymerase sigma-70 factor (ECF subfamily)